MDKERLLEELYSSNFTMFLGNYGKGKSISLSYLAIMAAVLNKRKVVMSNTPIYNLSSYGLEFIPLISTSQFTENMRDIEILIDELQKVANSRNSLSAENSFVTEFSTDVRKFNQGVVGTSQYGNTYDIRLYDNTEIQITPNWITKEKKNRTNFMINWVVWFMDSQEVETVTLNLESIIDMYDTTYKPFKLVVNHEDYMDNLSDKHKSDYVDKYILTSNKAIKKANDVFDEQMGGRY